MNKDLEVMFMSLNFVSQINPYNFKSDCNVEQRNYSEEEAIIHTMIIVNFIMNMENIIIEIRKRINLSYYNLANFSSNS